MPPTHPSQADVAAAYRTLIAHETEPKEQDFYRTRLQRLEQATEPECEFDCRRRVAAAGVGVYCPQCSAKCADTDLTTNLAKAIRAAWVDRLDWDELAHAALKFLTSTGRLIPAGGRGLEFSEVEALRSAWEELKGYRVDGYARPYVNQMVKVVGALFPATEPAGPCSRGVCSANNGHEGTCAEASGWAEPAEEETKAELCAVRLCVLPTRHSGVHADREGLRWNNPTSSPVAPAPTVVRERCHDCSCHINPPCGRCVECKHVDYPDCENDCQDCEDHQETPAQAPAHKTTCTDGLVRGQRGTIATCTCGWRDAWGMQDGSAEASAHAHGKTHSTKESDA